MLMSSISQLIDTYGLVVVAGLICLESVALPVPGETVLILAAVFAGLIVNLTLSNRADRSDSGGCWSGNRLRDRPTIRLSAVVKYGGYLRITEKRIKLGEYLFLRYGIAIVIVARFIPVLRSIIGILAGANRMPWPPFLFANIVGALMWTSVVGYLSFLFGSLVHRVGHWIAIAIGVVAVTAIIGVNFLRRHEERLVEEAELALPGPLASR